ncbi:hypothetical protein CIHG_07081 [Coccidioides immitis H538.4]|uniref:Uncharacterized protein n=3 Tax=Coccidioides immitis TaxID=5501 RepID=A0A0J8TK33_COCIT|nr:hypothetical protein CIRG_08594 [Coccidioides immitis RMSCC 2394]KMU74067.1 hypothetical protein CISG_03996 [Coccidioides immitis RMSCC 3703]KMU89149.1 hypothetical protein CIHG_07081 [Coccidioides immitis H538.4]
MSRPKYEVGNLSFRPGLRLSSSSSTHYGCSSPGFLVFLAHPTESNPQNVQFKTRLDSIITLDYPIRHALMSHSEARIFMQTLCSGKSVNFHLVITPMSAGESQEDLRDDALGFRRGLHPSQEGKIGQTLLHVLQDVKCIPPKAGFPSLCSQMG